MEDDQDSGDDLEEIKLSALSILERINSPDTADVQKAMGEYTALVDRFYEVEENLAPHQYRPAKQDFEYFMRLLDLAIHYSAMSGQSDKGTM